MFPFKSHRRPLNLSLADVNSDATTSAALAKTDAAIIMRSTADTSLRTARSSSSATMSHTKPVSIPSRASSRSSTSTTRTTRWDQDRPKPRRMTASSDTSNKHRPDAMPASVAALLAMTSIPPRKSTRKLSQQQQPRQRDRRISIEELVQEWKTEDMSYSPSHKSMEILLEPCDIACADSLSSSLDAFPGMRAPARSISSDSIPSLDPDDRSLLSLGNPPTPDSLRIQRSSSTSIPRRTKPRSLTNTQSCASDHPLIPRSAPVFDDLPEDDLIVTPPKSPQKQKSSFKSNLTSSLQTLKHKALSSISQFSLTAGGPNPTYNPYQFSDATLWQHPFLFPYVGPEIRPNAFADTPTESERRYFNPMVLSFDEKQSHFRKALHSSEPRDYFPHRSPMIQMQTYNNSTRQRRSGPLMRSKTTDPQRSVPMVSRQREPRENADFLRVVVLEMNMRRKGKLDDAVAGRARIWLPPREQKERLPRRWTSIGVEEE